MDILGKVKVRNVVGVQVVKSIGDLQSSRCWGQKALIGERSI